MRNAGVAAVIDRFADHELAIRRLYAADREFRAACDDYAATMRALALWRDDKLRADDYRRLIEELEAEILALVAPPMPASAGRWNR